MNAGGQFLHRLADETSVRQIARPKHQAKRVHHPPRDWPALATRYARDAQHHRQPLAAQLGVATDALVVLDVGWDAERGCWTFPERDADGHVIGIATRYFDGSKKRMAGGRAGLTYADDWETGDSPILLVEGGSDTAALLSCGLCVVGRPSNTGGVNQLINLLKDVPYDRQIIVIGERDEKPDGRWPGREGAIGTAKKLAEELERPIAWALPPDHAKDARSWLNAMPRLSQDRLADLFVSGLDTTVLEPPLVFHLRKPCGPSVPVDDWREQMLQVRLHSLGCPGLYLDASTTGAGKSHIDRPVILHAMGWEEAA